MAWEERSGRVYYYRKERQGSRVRSVYCGTGLLAEFAELMVGFERLERDELKEEWEPWIEAEKEVAQVCEEAERQVCEAMENAGYHKHRGQWRKRRAGRAGLCG